MVPETFVRGRQQCVARLHAILMDSRDTAQSGMRKRPIELSSFGIQGAKWQCTIIDPSHRDYFGIISSREYLVSSLKVFIGESFFDHRRSSPTQQSDHALRE